MTGVERSVLETIDAHGPMSVATLAKTLDHHPITIDRYCHELQQHGHLRLRSSGIYALTDSGKEHLAMLTR